VNHLLNRLFAILINTSVMAPAIQISQFSPAAPSNNSHATGDTHKAAKNTAPFVFDI